jgi:Zn-dependent alcohol dehydrogenase
MLLFSDAGEIPQMPKFHRYLSGIGPIRKMSWTHGMHYFTICALERSASQTVGLRGGGLQHRGPWITLVLNALGRRFRFRERRHCWLYLVGVARPEVNIDLNIFDAIGGQKRIVGVNFGSTNFKRDIPMDADLHLQGRINSDDLISKRIELRDVNEGCAAIKDGSLNRVVVTSFGK